MAEQYDARGAADRACYEWNDHSGGPVIVSVLPQLRVVTQINALIPDLVWLTATEDVDESWLGPGPKLCNLRPWIDALASKGKHTLVAATYAAAKAASHYWDAWLAADQQMAMESILDGDTPTKQLAAVDRWLAAPTDSNKATALDTVDHTKQLHWFHEEYSDRWFSEPGMWAVESCEFSVLTITGDSCSHDSLKSHATLSILCAINAFRKHDAADLRAAISTVTIAIKRQLEQAE